ncbi:MAG: hypothetical protein H6657_29750 [Ardenticatenaceae bacterium]|nr:hypothetical protein [Ardenticatenaceae bacterium]
MPRQILYSNQQWRLGFRSISWLVRAPHKPQRWMPAYAGMTRSGSIWTD